MNSSRWYCYLNKAFLPVDQAHISIDDRGFLLADGVFTTFRCYQGQAFALFEHWQRLQQGAQQLYIPFVMTHQELIDIVKKLTSLNHLTQHDSSIRVTLTRGPAPRGLALPATSKPTLLIQQYPYSTSMMPEPWKLSANFDYSFNYHPLSHLKTLAYLSRIIVRQKAAECGFNDVLLFNSSQELVSSSCANVFLVISDHIYTPQLSSGTVDGVMRRKVIELARRLHVPCDESSLRLSDVMRADEIWLTNSLLSIQPVAQFEQVYFKMEEAAPITQQLQQALYQEIATVINPF